MYDSFCASVDPPSLLIPTMSPWTHLFLEFFLPLFHGFPKGYGENNRMLTPKTAHLAVCISYLNRLTETAYTWTKRKQKEKTFPSKGNRRNVLKFSEKKKRKKNTKRSLPNETKRKKGFIISNFSYTLFLPISHPPTLIFNRSRYEFY